MILAVCWGRQGDCAFQVRSLTDACHGLTERRGAWAAQRHFSGFRLNFRSRPIYGRQPRRGRHHDAARAGGEMKRVVRRLIRGEEAPDDDEAVEVLPTCLGNGSRPAAGGLDDKPRLDRCGRRRGSRPRNPHGSGRLEREKCRFVGQLSDRPRHLASVRGQTEVIVLSSRLAP